MAALFSSRAASTLAVVVVVGLLAMAQQSMQLSMKNPVNGVIRETTDTAYIALVMTASSHESALNRSNYFVADSSYEINGRTYRTGKINGVDVVYVVTGGTIINAALSVQTLISNFALKGLVLYGTAGSSDDSLAIGSVSVAKKVAFTGIWEWQNASTGGQLVFKDYNTPDEGDNLLGSVIYDTIKLYRQGKAPKTVFWISVNATWYNFAVNNLQGLPLQSCIESGNCMTTSPQLVFGLRGVSADIYIKNAAYRAFIHSHFKASTVDEESAAFAFTCETNGLPYVIFRGITNTAGGSTADSSFSYLGTVNALEASVKFITAIGASSSVARHY